MLANKDTKEKRREAERREAKRREQKKTEDTKRQESRRRDTARKKRKLKMKEGKETKADLCTCYALCARTPEHLIRLRAAFIPAIGCNCSVG